MEVPMIKKGLVNYFKSLKHFFTPLGTMFLGMMIGLSILIPGILASTTSLIEGINELSQSVNLDFKVLFNEIWNSIRALDWNDPEEAINIILSKKWLHEMLTTSLQTILGTDFETFKQLIVDQVGIFTSQIAAYIVVFFVFWILGFLFGFFLLKVFIRNTVAKRAWWKFFIAYFLNSILTTLLVVTCVVVLAKWKYSIYISIVILLILVGVFELFQAYLLYGLKKVKISDVVNLKNIGLYMLTNLLIFAISAAFTLIAVLINNLMGLFVGLSVFSIAIIVIGLNAESYVQSVVEVGKK